MSWELTARSKPCPTCGHYESDCCWNSTNNVDGMMKEAGCRIYDLKGLSTDDALIKLNQVVTAMLADPARFRNLEAGNGWGTYDQLLPILLRIKEFLSKNPGGTVDVRW